MKKRTLNVVSWSGGKDSTATIILAHELGIHIDLILISLPWFDRKRKIYADHPEHVRWVLDVAIPTFESWGYRVEVLSDPRDYLHWFHKKKFKSKHPEQNGMKYGFVIGGMCKFNQSKVAPIRNFLKKLFVKTVMFEGIAADEEDRLKGMHENRGHRSLLEELNIYEVDTYPICRSKNLLSPVYAKRCRQGCWFCPNQSIAEMAEFKMSYPHLWNELAILAKETNTATKGFQYGKTFEQVDAMVDEYIRTKGESYGKSN